ncbi:MAG: glutamine synthetase adenylyltransferase [Planctomycetaceae bacterium]|nr:glutamine synthetase adenylyltransferase [Planctomycetaceae bacterium]
MFEQARRILDADEPLSAEDAYGLLAKVGVSDVQGTYNRILELAEDDVAREPLADCLPILLTALNGSPKTDAILVSFDRFVRSVDDLSRIFTYLSQYPRAIEILVKVFVRSQFLTEILVNHTSYLESLTQQRRLAEFKSRDQFVLESKDVTDCVVGLEQKFEALRRVQRWELLRIGACDCFGLMDLKTVTVQLSLMADAMVQMCLRLIQERLDVDISDFTVLAFGKHGGEELNYSSDIDLVFLSNGDPGRYWKLGQQLIKTLKSSTSEGFLYRTDMRLRPWGQSGPLVTSAESYLDYLENSAEMWEKQALLKARPVAGNLELGEQFLRDAEPIVFGAPPEKVRESVRAMKDRIESGLKRSGRDWGEVKLGAGSIRDIEFVTQLLQLTHGGQNPHVRSINTLNGLMRLVDFGFIQADEYRQLTSGYIFLRTIEHSLQLMHHKQTHALPESEDEQLYLAKRLDFADSQQLLTHYEQHRDAIREIYEKYVGGGTNTSSRIAEEVRSTVAHIDEMEPLYSKIYSDQEIERHGRMLEQLDADQPTRLEVEDLSSDRWRLTIVGYDHTGNLSIISGLLFVHGLDIVDANAFTVQRKADQHVIEELGQRPQPPGKSRKFVNVFTVRRRGSEVVEWGEYEEDLSALLALVRNGELSEPGGQLAKRVAAALRAAPDLASAVYPIEITIDNEASPYTTALRIDSQDSSGFLYELSNALTMSEIDVLRLTALSIGNRVFDTLYVTDRQGEKITDPQRLQELRFTVALIKHFAHLLPTSPNPESALLHFRELLEQLLKQPNWFEEMVGLQESNVLAALARLLGVSDFLWDDFLRVQHQNLFPILQDIEGLQSEKTASKLTEQLAVELQRCESFEDRIERLNAFKDREMFRTDMRHIMRHVTEFGQFSDELSDVAEVVVAEALRICLERLHETYGEPKDESGSTIDWCVCALGKFGGRELGFASDIELMFLYRGEGRTSGPKSIAASRFFQKLVEQFQKVIQHRRKGIFEVDLRLRPYGQAGSAAVPLNSFAKYFSADGDAWPFERQALVKLRHVAGMDEFGSQIIGKRDDLIYRGEPFDTVAMRAMRERQVRQLVQADEFNAKLSYGGLVDCEYLVQSLQINHGHESPELRSTNTSQAIQGLANHGKLNDADRAHLQDAYIFLRRLIDALRMVRGDARDLTLPAVSSDDFEYLARRLQYAGDTAQFEADIEKHRQNVIDLGRLLSEL